MSNRGRMHNWKKSRPNLYRNLLNIVQHYNKPAEADFSPPSEHLRGYVSKCHTSTLLSFSRPSSEILLCVINQYESEEFLSCLSIDRILGGAQCVKKSFEKCFKLANKCNDMSVGDVDTHSDVCMSNSNSDSDKILEVFGRNPYHATYVHIF